MIRRLTIALSLAATSLGIFLITRVHAIVVVCNAGTIGSPGAGLSTNCMNRISLYFVGFILTIGGLMLLMLSLLAAIKRSRNASVARTTPIATLGERKDSLRDVA